jgi:hypothetical protein
MPGSRSVFRGGGFWLVTGERWGEYHYAAFLPAWFVFATSVVLPLSRALHAARSKEPDRRGFCPACGYDLRATPERCPECGRVSVEEIGK